jgi:uncharacterized membrane protein YkoI
MLTDDRRRRGTPGGAARRRRTKEKPMVRQPWYKAVAVVGLLALVGQIRADEEKVPLDKVPKPVVDAVKAKFPGAELTGASKEAEDGKTVYEVTVKNKGQNIDVTLTPDGTIQLLEKTITTKDLPKAVTATLGAKYPKAKHEIVEEVIKVQNGRETLDYYEVLLTTADNKKLEVEIAPDGTIKKVEDKAGKKD